MKKEYAIIYWIHDVGPFFQKNIDTILIFNQLEDADKTANSLESNDPSIQCRVISLDSVHE